jgi:predicted NBD/HSP70 family sugar kinase
MKVYCGIDIGGTRVRIILIDSSKQILAKDQFPLYLVQVQQSLWKS